MSYSIKTEVSRSIVAGVLKESSFSYVADADGNLVGKKGYSTVEEAQAELDGLGDYLTGLEFAKAQFPKDGDKAHVAKANVVARFLTWEREGRPVLTAEAEAAPSDEAEPAPSEIQDGETF